MLRALLPEQGSAIKGNMQSLDKLLLASGYARRPGDFEELLRILDGEVRLITPTQPPEHGRGGRGQPDAAAEKYYQLTHDYLVHSLRAWLTRKQRETRRGRAELRLAERAAFWEAKPESRHLPALWEWLNIRLLTRERERTPPQRRMMRKAARSHGVRAAVLAVLLAAGLVAALRVRSQVIEQGNAEHAAALVRRLLDADVAQVPDIVEDIAGYRRWADPLLRQKNQDAKDGSRQKLYTSMALLPVDEGQAEYLYQRLLIADPVELPVLRDALLPQHDALRGRLWGVLESPQADPEQRFRAACALAAYDDAGPQRWQGVSPFVADRLLAAVRQNPGNYDPLLKMLARVRANLIGPLSEVFRDRERPDADRSWAASVLAEYAAQRPGVLADLLLDADDRQFAVLWPKAEARRQDVAPICEATLDTPLEKQKTDEEREHLAKRQANSGVALLRLGRAEKVWPILRHSPDPRARSYLIDRVSVLGVDPSALVGRLESEKELPIRRALLLSLGGFSAGQLPLASRESLMPIVLRLYREEPDSGLHGAAEWLLRVWGQSGRVQELEQEWANDQRRREERQKRIRGELPEGTGQGEGRWYVNGQGQTLVVLPGPVEFMMGSPPTEAGRGGGPAGQLEVLHRKRIPRSFAIAAREVTVAQLLRFRKDYDYNKAYAPTPDCPVDRVRWYDAAAYCNWLSEQEGIPRDQWCYEPNARGQYAEGMKPAPDYLERTGYRLPSEAEWEFACRANASTSRFFGETEELLGKYAWTTKDSLDRGFLPGVPGRFRVPGDCVKPNDFGLFDMLGNALEWCEDRIAPYRSGDDVEDSGDAKDTSQFVLRGGAFVFPTDSVRSAFRGKNVPTYYASHVGFRPARTFR